MRLSSRKIAREISRPFQQLFGGYRSGRLHVSDIAALLGRDDPVILEIGANDGADTAQFVKCFPKARVFAFEPDPRAIALWRTRLENAPQAKLFEIALGATDGEAAFYPSGGERGKDVGGWNKSGSLLPPTDLMQVVHPWLTFGEPQPIKVQRLDSWAREHNIRDVDFIWADVQGAEADLIRGGTSVLSRTRYFYTEYSEKVIYDGQPSLRDILNLLPQFKIARRYPNDVLLRNRQWPPK